MLSRRHFLGTAATAAAAGAAAPAFAASTSASGMPAKWDMETDVVVLGCGGAGMMAACQVVDAARRSKSSTPASPVPYCHQSLRRPLHRLRSKLQKADPTIKDSWEAFAEDIMAYGNYMSLKGNRSTPSPKHSGEAFDWLSDHGLAAHHL